mgnify:CR=1 FL=1
MTYLHTNLKYLRQLNKRSQDVAATAVDVPRSTYAAWEQGATEPNCFKLLALGAYYRTSLDILIAKDLTQLRPSEVEQLQAAY